MVPSDVDNYLAIPTRGIFFVIMKRHALVNEMTTTVKATRRESEKRALERERNVKCQFNEMVAAAPDTATELTDDVRVVKGKDQL